MQLPPIISEKGGLSPEVFGMDKNGFYQNLLMTDGEKWHKERKVISKILHLDVLEKYVEPMNVSAITLTDQLCKSDGFQVKMVLVAIL